MGATFRSTKILWPSGLVPFRLHPNFTQVTAAVNAMRAWENVTNLRFVRRQPHQRDFIEFINHPTIGACNSSDIGRKGGRQVVRCSLGGVGVATHEIGHAVGLIHEHQRSDRNNFVRVFPLRAVAIRRANFNRLSNSRNGPVYDFRSIMHYTATTFAINPANPPIVRIGTGSLNGSNALTGQDRNFVNTIYPNLGVVRRGDPTHSAAGKILGLSTLPLPGNRLLTAVRTQQGKLKLIQWNTNALGNIGRLAADSGNQAGTAKSVDIAGSNIIVSAVQSGSNRLLLLSWQVQSNQILRLADSGSLAGSATKIKIISLTSTVFVTACRASGGRLLLISWRVDSAGRFRRLADSGTQAGRISSLSMVRVSTNGSNHLVATTVATQSGSLKSIVWRVSGTSGAITRRGDSGNAMGAGTQVATTMSPSGHLLVSCKTRDSARRLKIIAFSISSTGTTVRRVGDSGRLAGRIGLNSILARPYGAVSAVSISNGHLKLIKWNVSATGRLTRVGDSADQAGKISLVSTILNARPNAPICTFFKAGNQNLSGITWDDLSATGELQ